MSMYSETAVFRAKHEAIDWLRANRDGYPRSWKQIHADDERRGYVFYDDYDFEAPPIAGYEALESEGRVLRLGTVSDSVGSERVHFRLRG